MKRIVILFGVLLFLIVAIKISGDYIQNKSLPFFSKPQAILGTKTISLTVAKTQKEKQIGLSDKETLPQDQGMAFPFQKPGFYSFWMRGMKFPIDIIFLRSNKIITIFENVQPPIAGEQNPQILNPEEPVDTVLEINAGLAKKYNLKKGDTIRMNF